MLKQAAVGLALIGGLLGQSFAASSAETSFSALATFSSVTQSGNFDLSWLNSSGYQFNTGFATFNFHGASTYTLTDSSTINYGSYNSSSVGSTTTNNYSDSIDKAQVTIANQSATGSNANSYSQSSTSSSTSSHYSYQSGVGYQPYTYYQYYTYSCGTFNTSTCTGSYPVKTYTSYPIYSTGTATNTTVTNKSGYEGDFSIVIAFDKQANSNINNGMLPFTFSALSGAPTLTSARLDYSTIAAVPEPESYAMLMAGLGVIGAVARRRRDKQPAL